MGAVNCVVNRDGKFIGENTDGKGFVSSLKELEDPIGKTVVIFGWRGIAGDQRGDGFVWSNSFDDRQSKRGAWSWTRGSAQRAGERALP